MLAPPSEETLDRMISSLNADFGLELRNDHALLSPSKRRSLLRTEEEGRVDLLYRKIRFLHYNGGDRLTACLGRFRMAAGRLLAQSTGRSHAAASISYKVSAAERAELQLCLLDILQDCAISSPVQPCKRLPDEAAHSQAKRPRSRGREAPGQSNEVDELPVRTKVCPQYCRASASATPRPDRGIKSYFQTSSSSIAPTGSTRTSRAPSVFSSGASGRSDNTLPTDTESSPDEATNDPYPICEQGLEAIIESFDKFNSPEEGRSRSFPEDIGRPFFTWPKPPNSGLNEAPLGVVWEVTRVAQHCGVEAADCHFTYAPNDQWQDHLKFLGMLTQHHAFAGKGLPPMSDPEAWTLAVTQSEFRGETFTLSAELIQRPGNTGPLYELRLSPLKMELGHRLSRRFGADRFLEVNMPPLYTLQDRSASSQSRDPPVDIIRWLTGGTHYFLGRQWKAFFVRSVKKTSQAAKKLNNQYFQRVYFFATDGDTFRVPASRDKVPPAAEASTPGTRTKFSRRDFLQWALNIQQNHEEPVLKLFARLALSLSRTWATVQLEPDQMYHRERDTGTHKVMNDGVGQMSRRLASEIASCLGLTETPAGYQGRIGCAKGMWIVDVEDDGLDDDIWIETYPSQRKWACDWQDLEHRCFEVKTWSRQAKPAALNQQFIPLLEAQAISPGQMRETIAEHMRRNLAEELGGQSAALGNPEDLRLWVDRVGQSRTLMPLHRSIPLLGGLPATDEDLVGLLLDAGFDHLKLKILQGVLYDIGKKKADTLKAKTNVRIPQSTYLLMVADFTGTLEEGEVQVSFSTKYKVDGFCDTLLEEMDVLVARSPAHLPSDIQRVRAMSYPRLRKLKDVVIFSTKGRTPLADLLSGGDYDGDLAWVCWDRDIVNNFRNAPLLTAPDQISRNLFDRGYVKKLATKVGEILKEQRTVQAMCDKFVFSGFYFNMQQSHLGMITKYKEKLCYHRDSAGSDSAIQLSALLGLLVDQGKQGIIFSGKHWDKFRREVINGPPGLDDPEYFGERPTNTPTKHGRRHILDYLKFQVAEQAVNDNLTMFQSAISSRGGQEYDADLTKMYNDYELRAENSETCRQLLKCLRADIDAVKVMWQKVITKSDKEGESDYTTKVNEVYRKWMDIDPPEELQSSDLVQMLKEGWSRDPHSSPWALLKASATFRYHHKVQSFTWRMAGMQLCYLKSKMAAKTLPAAIVQLGMWACLRADKKSIMARSAQRRESMREGESFAALDLDERMEDDGYGYEIDDT